MTPRVPLCALIAWMAVAWICYGQARGGPTFDIASVRPASFGRGETTARGGGPGTSDPGRFLDTGDSLATLVMIAYGVGKDQVVGPDWIQNRKYAIHATMPPDTTPEDFHLMLRNLLADRFSLEFHRQKRDLPAFVLEAAGGGPKMNKWLATDSRPDLPFISNPSYTTIPAGLMVDDHGFPVLTSKYTFAVTWSGPPAWMMRVGCRGCTMGELAEQLSGFFMARRWYSAALTPTSLLPHVVDRTGLTGGYKFNLEFKQLVPEIIKHGPEDGVSIYDALGTQLGLKLERGKRVPMEVIVIDHAEKTPLPN
jgi:uncharacterized protein (TIGR03435 family)